MKILFYCLNGTGIGHLTRTLSLVESLKKTLPKSKIEVLTNGVFDPGFQKLGVPFHSTKYSNIDIHKNPLLESKVNKELFERINSFRPNIIFFDNKIPPFANKVNSFKVLVLRSLKEENMIKTLDKFSSLMDLFIVPHDISELEEQYSKTLIHKLKTNHKILVLGPIIKKKYSPKSLKKIKKCIVSFGGGGPHAAFNKGEFFGDVEHYAQVFLNFFINNKFDFPIDLILGPNFDSKLFSKLVSKAKSNKSIKILRLSDNYFSDLSSSIIFSLTGYNSVNELLYLQVPAIFFSKRGVSESQLNRGKWIQKKNLGLFISEVNEKTISRSILKLLSQRQKINSNLKKLNIQPKNDLIIKKVIKNYDKHFFS